MSDVSVRRYLDLLCSLLLTRSMRVALADLRLQRLDVIHAGERTYPLASRVRALAFARALQDIPPL